MRRSYWESCWPSPDSMPTEGHIYPWQCWPTYLAHPPCSCSRCTTSRYHRPSSPPSIDSLLYWRILWEWHTSPRVGSLWSHWDSSGWYLCRPPEWDRPVDTKTPTNLPRWVPLWSGSSNPFWRSFHQLWCTLVGRQWKCCCGTCPWHKLPGRCPWDSPSYSSDVAPLEHTCLVGVDRLLIQPQWWPVSLWLTRPVDSRPTLDSLRYSFPSWSIKSRLPCVFRPRILSEQWVV